MRGAQLKRPPYDVERVRVEDMLRERRALLARLEAERPYPGLERFIGETKCGIERLERRLRGREPDTRD